MPAVRLNIKQGLESRFSSSPHMRTYYQLVLSAWREWNYLGRPLDYLHLLYEPGNYKLQDTDFDIMDNIAKGRE